MGEEDAGTEGRVPVINDDFAPAVCTYDKSHFKHRPFPTYTPPPSFLLCPAKLFSDNVAIIWWNIAANGQTKRVFSVESAKKMPGNPWRVNDRHGNTDGRVRSTIDWLEHRRFRLSTVKYAVYNTEWKVREYVVNKRWKKCTSKKQMWTNVFFFFFSLRVFYF